MALDINNNGDGREESQTMPVAQPDQQKGPFVKGGESNGAESGLYMDGGGGECDMNGAGGPGHQDAAGGDANKLCLLQSNANLQAIEVLLKRTGYPLRQENGQRKYGPPPNWGIEPEPDRGCEIFIGKIPRDCFEDEIIPLLERIGPIYEFRLMMEYSGYNRGYGFAMFTCRDDAKKAVTELNNYEIRKGRMIGICRSVDNCRLFVGGIPKNKTKEEIMDEMRKVTDDVVNVIVYPSAHDKSKNRGFAFVQYTNHRAAAIARRKLIPNRIQLFGQPIAVDWAEPEPEVDEDVMATVKVLYVRNLMLSTTEETIKAEFEKIKEGMIERVKKMKDFAFVHFKERQDALRCMKLMNGATIDGAIVEVSLSKPIDKNYVRFTRGTPSPTSSIFNTALAAAAAAAGVTANPSPVLTLPFQSVGASVIDAPSPNTVAAAGQPTPAQLQYSFPSIPGLPTIPIQQTSSVAATSGQVATSYQMQTQYLPHAAGTAGSPYPSDLLLGTLNQHQTSGLNSGLNAALSKTPHHRSSRAVSGSRATPGLYRYYVKGVASTVKKQASSQDIPYDLYSGINPVPVLPFNPFVNYPNKTSTQILEEICFKEGFGLPSYTLHTTNGTDQDGREIGLFIYKITIPGLFNGKPISSNKLLRTIDEAKTDAAEFVLSQIYPQSFVDPNDYYLNAQTQSQAAVQTPSVGTLQPQSSSIQPQTIIYQNPNDSMQRTNLLQTNGLLQQQQQHPQQQPQSNGSISTSANPDLNGAGLYAPLSSLTPQQQSQLLNSTRATNPGSEYMASNSAAAPPIIHPQYILDPTGQYIVCQTLWQ